MAKGTPAYAPQSLLQLLELDVSPRGGEGAGFFTDAVDLQADVAFGVGFVDFLIAEIGDEGAIEPDFDIRAFGDDAEVIPLAVFKVFVRGEFILGGDPAASGRFTVDVSCFCSVFAAGFGLDLRAVEAATKLAFFDIF